MLEPLLGDLLTVMDLAPQSRAEADSSALQTTAGDVGANSAHLILEFGHSRSEFFAFALRQAQKQNGFVQLMDENRHVICRVPFRRNDMRRFWTLWDCVQGWSSTTVYCEGRKLEKWQVYPYSQYLR